MFSFDKVVAFVFFVFFTLCKGQLMGESASSPLQFTNSSGEEVVVPDPYGKGPVFEGISFHSKNQLALEFRVFQSPSDNDTRFSTKRPLYIYVYSHSRRQNQGQIYEFRSGFFPSVLNIAKAQWDNGRERVHTKELELNEAIKSRKELSWYEARLPNLDARIDRLCSQLTALKGEISPSFYLKANDQLINWHFARNKEIAFPNYQNARQIELTEHPLLKSVFTTNAPKSIQTGIEATQSNSKQMNPIRESKTPASSEAAPVELISAPIPGNGT